MAAFVGSPHPYIVAFEQPPLRRLGWQLLCSLRPPTLLASALFNLDFSVLEAAGAGASTTEATRDPQKPDADMVTDASASWERRTPSRTWCGE
jgi:hypothetical protein